jgi:prepilin-type N-terminal cleavage/methylation domain-containing protein
MQTFSPLPIRSSYILEYKSHKGFTLVELLVSIGIIGLVTGIVLVKYSAFDSTILLKNTAYEIALALREAQVKSVSVSYQNATADYPFGVTFVPTQKNYVIFRYADATAYPIYDRPGVNPKASGVSTSTIGRTMKIKEVCYTLNGTWDPSNCRVSASDRLDVSFRRPEYKALIRASWYGGTQSNIIGAQIKVGSDSNENTFVVEVSNLGQISVFKE